MTKIPLSVQAAAVERAAVNHTGHCANLREMANRGKRPILDAEQQEAWNPALQAAAVTMRWLANNEDRVRAVIEESAA